MPPHSKILNNFIRWRFFSKPHTQLAQRYLWHRRIISTVSANAALLLNTNTIYLYYDSCDHTKRYLSFYWKFSMGNYILIVNSITTFLFRNKQKLAFWANFKSYNKMIRILLISVIKNSASKVLSIWFSEHMSLPNLRTT